MEIRESCLYCSRQCGDSQRFHVVASREIFTAGQVWSHEFSADPGHLRGMVAVVLLVLLERLHFLITWPLPRLRAWGCPRDRLDGDVPIVLFARSIPAQNVGVQCRAHLSFLLKQITAIRKPHPYGASRLQSFRVHSLCGPSSRA